MNDHDIKVFDRIVLVCGAGGVLGRAYVDFFSQDEGNLCYGFTRSKDVPPDKDNCKFRSLGIDPISQSKFLSSPDAFALNPSSNIREVTFVYAVGPSKFEPPEMVKENPKRKGIAHNIDEDIYSLNLLGFHNLTKEIFNSTKCKAHGERPIHIKLVAFASIADKHNPAFWHSYTSSKKILRRYIRSAVYQQRNDPEVDLAGVVVNVATIDTPNERKLRPFVSEEERTQWLTPQQIVERSEGVIKSIKPGSYDELNIYNPWAGFSREMYWDLPDSRRRWALKLSGKTSVENRPG